MRDVIRPQLRLDEPEIGAIELDPKSRDDIPQILRGLQHIYTRPAIRERVFAILEEVMPIGIGSRSSGPLPQHRTYGSVYGA
jgi:IS5 family transposase